METDNLTEEKPKVEEQPPPQEEKQEEILASSDPYHLEDKKESPAPESPADKEDGLHVEDDSEDSDFERSETPPMTKEQLEAESSNSVSALGEARQEEKDGMNQTLSST